MVLSPWFCIEKKKKKRNKIQFCNIYKHTKTISYLVSDCSQSINGLLIQKMQKKQCMLAVGLKFVNF